MNTQRLRVVKDEPQIVDIYENWRADIAAINWSSTHIRGDRALPVKIDVRRWGWAK